MKNTEKIRKNAKKSEPHFPLLQVSTNQEHCFSEECKHEQNNEQNQLEMGIKNWGKNMPSKIDFGSMQGGSFDQGWSYDNGGEERGGECGILVPPPCKAAN